MSVFTKKAGSIFIPLPLLLFIIFSLLTPSLFARGSGEFSDEYRENLQILFEDVITRIESKNMNGLEAKNALALLRSEYRVVYNDFAGKIDALIDDVDENRKGSMDAIIYFTKLENELITKIERVLKGPSGKKKENGQGEHSSSQEENPSGGGGASSRGNY